MTLYLDSLKVRGRKILSEDTMNYLTAPGSLCAAYEFKQEGESDQIYKKVGTSYMFLRKIFVIRCYYQEKALFLHEIIAISCMNKTALYVN